MPYDPPPALGKLSLGEIAALVTERKLPPVESWQPEKSGDSEMHIAADGRWYHQGGEITRPAMIRAFSTLLRREMDGSYWLVTPHEMLSIGVEDVPFLAVEARLEGEGTNASIAMRLNTDDLVIAGPENSIELRAYEGTAVPYVHVRSGLWARCTRSVYYELAEFALASGTNPSGLWSNGHFFSFESAA